MNPKSNIREKVGWFFFWFAIALSFFIAILLTHSSGAFGPAEAAAKTIILIFLLGLVLLSILISLYAGWQLKFIRYCLLVPKDSRLNKLRKY